MATPKTKRAEQIDSDGSYRGDKKAYKSRVKENKKIVKSTKKKNRSSQKSHNKMVKEGNKNYEKELKEAPNWERHHIKARKPIYDFAPKDFPPIQAPMDKPKRSDYKGSTPDSRPQRATGSSASKKRNAAMVSKMNKRHRGR